MAILIEDSVGTFQLVHLRRTDEGSNKEVNRVLIQILRCGNLLDKAVTS